MQSNHIRLAHIYVNLVAERNTTNLLTGKEAELRDFKAYYQPSNIQTKGGEEVWEIQF